MLLTAKISVLIPVFNSSLFIDECLSSILKQTLQNIELICINDGSTDDSLTKLLSWQEKDPRIKTLTQENKGVGATRNIAIQNATGEYIAFIDPDDWYPKPDILETLYTKAVKNNANICGGSFSDFNNGTYNTFFTEGQQKYTFKKEGFMNFNDYQFDYGFTRFIYKRDFILNSNICFPNYKRFQDPPFFVSAMIHSKKILCHTKNNLLLQARA